MRPFGRSVPTSLLALAFAIACDGEVSFSGASAPDALAPGADAGPGGTAPPADGGPGGSPLPPDAAPGGGLLPDAHAGGSVPPPDGPAGGSAPPLDARADGASPPPDARPTDDGGPGGTIVPPDAAGGGPGDAGPPPADTGAGGHVPPPDAGVPPVDDVVYAGHLPAASGASQAALTVAGLARTAEVYVPARPAARPALVVALHGTWGRATDLVGAHRPQGFENLADAHGFILVGPNSRQLVEGDWDQHDAGVQGRTYWETLPTDDPARGADPDRNPDLLFIRAVIADARLTYDVDPTRIYLVGHSNGGFFATHVAVVLADRIAAFVAASSGLVRCPSTATCQFRGNGATCDALRADPAWCACNGPEKPIPIPAGRMPPGFLTHATDDDIVSVYYSCELESRMRALNHEVQVQLRAAGRHPLPPGFADDAWSFLSAHTL